MQEIHHLANCINSSPFYTEVMLGPYFGKSNKLFYSLLKLNFHFINPETNTCLLLFIMQINDLSLFCWRANCRSFLPPSLSLAFHSHLLMNFSTSGLVVLVVVATASAKSKWDFQFQCKDMYIIPVYYVLVRHHDLL